MSIGFQHPNVKTHIGDGFQFLKDRQNEFDVIITDSSDPEGPAESLFQKPYFELLRDALRDGGVITTPGCSSPFFYLLHFFARLFIPYFPTKGSPSSQSTPSKMSLSSKSHSSHSRLMLSAILNLVSFNQKYMFFNANGR